tara:strand:- start:2296 stop:2517 length:222 start_codon:yes stop_codon:yes gene_type:complete
MNIKEVISLVEKWIAAPESVSYEELRAACDAVHAVHAEPADAAWYAVHAAAALNGDIDDAKYWVAEYHKLIKD